MKFKWKLKNNLDYFCDQFKGFSIVVSPAGEGKTLFLLNLAEIYSKKGKNLLFLSSYDFPNLKSKHATIKFNEDLFSYLDTQIKGKNNLDYIIIDNIDNICHFPKNNYIENKEFFIKIRKFIIENNICVIMGINAIKQLFPNQIEAFSLSYTSSIMHIADFALGLRKYTSKKVPNKFQRIIQKIFGKRYNIILKILKNRDGQNNISFFAKINENKLGLKLVKQFKHECI
jgi:hypothetical protein